MTIAEAVKHDRTVRQKLSRRKYADLTGITENRVHAIEHDRKLKGDEAQKLQSYVGDLVDLSVQPTTRPRQEQPRPQPQPQPLANQDEYLNTEAERFELGESYISVMERLAGRVPPYPWPSSFRLETAPPSEFTVIREWIDMAEGWIEDQEQGQATPAPTEGTFDDELVDEEAWYDPAPRTGSTVEPPAPMASTGDGAEGFQPPAEAPAPGPMFTLDPNVWYVTNGELQTFKDCERRWYLSDYLQLGFAHEKVTGPAAIGTRYHRALAAWYRPTPGDPWDEFNRSVVEDQQKLEDSQAPSEVIKNFELEVDLVRAMIEGYFEWVEQTSADVGMRIVAPEAVHAVNPQFPELPHARLLAKLDTEVENEVDNSRAFIDHKTVQSFQEAIKILHMDEQMLHYNLIRYLKIVEQNLQTEIRTAGAIYNMARKVKRTPQAMPPFYGREQVNHNLEQLRSYWLRVKGTAVKIGQVRDQLANGADHREVAPPRPERDCSWKCEFFALCPMMDHSPNGAADYMREQLVHVPSLKRYEPDAIGQTL